MSQRKLLPLPQENAMNAPISFVLPVCPTVCDRAIRTRRIFVNFFFVYLLTKVCLHHSVRLKSAKSKTFMFMTFRRDLAL
jgi:hypothetical protein